MSVSNPGEKIEWGADSEPRKNVFSSEICTAFEKERVRRIHSIIRWTWIRTQRAGFGNTEENLEKLGKINKERSHQYTNT